MTIYIRSNHWVYCSQLQTCSTYQPSWLGLGRAPLFVSDDTVWSHMISDLPYLLDGVPIKSYIGIYVYLLYYYIIYNCLCMWASTCVYMCRLVIQFTGFKNIFTRCVYLCIQYLIQFGRFWYMFVGCVYVCICMCVCALPMYHSIRTMMWISVDRLVTISTLDIRQQLICTTEQMCWYQFCPVFLLTSRWVHIWFCLSVSVGQFMCVSVMMSH